MKNWKTTILGLLGGTSVTTAIAALASPEVMDLLQQTGVSPVWLIVIGGIAKICRDICAKDAESNPAAKAVGSVLLMSLAAALLMISWGCTTVNCSLLSGERNTVKADMDQSPTTKTDAKATIPLK